LDFSPLFSFGKNGNRVKENGPVKKSQGWGGTSAIFVLSSLNEILVIPEERGARLPKWIS
jgi:hypothetical protein